MDERTLGELADREAIYDVLTRFCRGVDRCDEALLRSTFHADASDDHGAYRGDPEGFIAWVKLNVQDRFRSTTHKLGNVLIELDGDRAQVESYAIGHHVGVEGGQDVRDTVIGLRYVDRFERRDGQWRIADRRVLYEWRRTDDLRETQLDHGWTLGRNDLHDPAYTHP